MEDTAVLTTRTFPVGKGLIISMLSNHEWMQGCGTITSCVQMIFTSETGTFVREYSVSEKYRKNDWQMIQLMI